MITPAILDRVIDVLRGGDGRLGEGVSATWLSGGDGEGVARVCAGGEAWALKLGALDDDAIRAMERECAAARWAAERALGPAVIAARPARGALLTACLPGEPLAPDALREPRCRARVASALRELHQSTALPWDLTLRSDLDDALARAPVATGLHAELEAAWDALARDPVADVPCHGDFHPGNLFDLGPRVVAIDWAAAGMGDAAWDLAMLASSAELDEAAWRQWLIAYYGEPTRVQRTRASAMLRLADAYCLAWYANNPAYDPGAAERFERRVRAPFDG